MFRDPQQFSFVLIIGLLLYWAIPARKPYFRSLVLIFVSGFFIYAVAYVSFLICVIMSVFATYLPRVFLRRKSPLMFWIVMLITISPFLYFRTIVLEAPTYVVIGLAYVVLKSASVVIETYRVLKKPKLNDVLLLNMFFPIYSGGPVEAPSKFRIDQLQMTFQWDFLIHGFSRICMGLFKVIFIGDYVLRNLMITHWPDAITDPSLYVGSQLLLYMVISFFYVYTNFSGYTDIAIGAGRTFGINVTENFNFPILATSIQEFWRRWHMTLGDWVIRNLYFPLVALIRRRSALFFGSLITFITLGIWHETSWLFLVWGIGHGAAMGMVQEIRRAFAGKNWYKKLSSMYAYSLFGWLSTLLYVSWLQTIARFEDIETAKLFTLKMIGLE